MLDGGHVKGKDFYGAARGYAVCLQKKGEFVAQKTGEIVIIRKQRVPSMFVSDLRKSQRIQPRNVLKERLKA
jgi:hypothetical protein